MRTGIVQLKPLTVVCARVVGPYSRASSEAWRELFSWLDGSGMRREVGCGYGLVREYPHDIGAECRYDACVELVAGFESSVPSGFRLLRLPSGSFARRRQIGAAGIAGTVRELSEGWLPAQGLSIDAERPFVEAYLDDPARQPVEKQRIDMCVPVMRVVSGKRTAA